MKCFSESIENAFCFGNRVSTLISISIKQRPGRRHFAHRLAQKSLIPRDMLTAPINRGMASPWRVMVGEDGDGHMKSFS